MGLAADVGAGAVVGVLEGALVDTGRRVLRRGEQAASTPEPADIAPRSSARREVSSVIGASLPVVSGQSALHRVVGEAETPLMQNATLEGRPSPVRSHAERLRRRGFRMMMFSAIAAPLLFVALVFGALGSAATLIGWRSFDTPPGASLDRRSRLLADVAVVGGLVSVAVVLVPGIARWL